MFSSINQIWAPFSYTFPIKKELIYIWSFFSVKSVWLRMFKTPFSIEKIIRTWFTIVIKYVSFWKFIYFIFSSSVVLKTFCCLKSEVSFKSISSSIDNNIRTKWSSILRIVEVVSSISGNLYSCWMAKDFRFYYMKTKWFGWLKAIRDPLSLIMWEYW